MAGTEVGSLYYDLSIDDNNLKKTLDDSNKSVQSFGDKVSSAGQKISAGLNAAAKSLAVVSVGLTAYAKSATDFTVDFVKSSKALGIQIGVSTTEASRLTAAFARMGLQADQTQQMFGIFSKQIVASTTNQTQNQLAFQKLQIQIQQTQQSINDTTASITKNGDSSGVLTLKLKELNNTLAGQKDALKQNADSFQKLGITTTDQSGKQKDFNTLLFEVADKFKAMPNGIDKTTIALNLFGRSGKDMIKVLDLGSQGIQELEKQADKLGLTLTPQTVGKINALIISQKNLKEQTDALKIAVGTATAPPLTTFNTAINDLIGSLLQSSGPMKTLTTDFLAFGGPVAGAGATLAAFLANITQTAGTIGKALLGFSVLALVIAAIGIAVYETIQYFGGWQNTLKKIQPLLDDLKQWFQDAKKLGIEAFKAIKDKADDVWAAVKLLTTGNFQGGIFGLNENAPLIQALEHIHNAFADIWNILQLVYNFVAANIVPVFNALVSVFQFLWPSIEAVFSSLWDRLLPALQQIWTAVVQLWNALNPALMDALKIIAAVVGVTLVGALWLAINAINLTISVFSFVIKIIADVISWLAQLISWYGNYLGIVINVVKGVISWFGQIPGAVGGVIGGIVDFFKSLPGKIGSVMGGVVDAVQSPFKTAFNAIAKFWNDTVGKLSFTAPSWVPGIGGKGFTMPKLPILDSGGIVTAPTMAILAANSKPEVVLPLDKLGKLGSTYNIERVVLSTAESVNAFFNINDRNIQLESMGISPIRS